jgi:acyl-coenzyme A thioesterase PaaI-like protein
MAEPCLQELYAPDLMCFGCGPANPDGLHVRSFLSGDEVIAEWQPSPHYQAFPGVLCGGIVGTLLDCHCNWTAAVSLMRARGDDRPPCTVTAKYEISLRRPTPLDQPLRLRAKALSLENDKAVIEGTLETGNPTVVCARCTGVFVAVKPGHPAYHRW